MTVYCYNSVAIVYYFISAITVSLPITGTTASYCIDATTVY